MIKLPKNQNPGRFQKPRLMHKHWVHWTMNERPSCRKKPESLAALIFLFRIWHNHCLSINPSNHSRNFWLVAIMKSECCTENIQNHKEVHMPWILRLSDPAGQLHQFALESHRGTLIKHIVCQWCQVYRVVMRIWAASLVGTENRFWTARWGFWQLSQQRSKHVGTFARQRPNNMPNLRNPFCQSRFPYLDNWCVWTQSETKELQVMSGSRIIESSLSIGVAHEQSREPGGSSCPWPAWQGYCCRYFLPNHNWNMQKNQEVAPTAKFDARTHTHTEECNQGTNVEINELKLLKNMKGLVIRSM